MIDTILGKKIEMSVRFDQKGRRIPVTLVKAGPCVVAQIKTETRDQYPAVQLGFLEKKRAKNVPLFLREVRSDQTQDLKLGQTLKVSEIFRSGDLIRVTGTSKGKGFTGVMKRWGFAGGPATHGQSDRARAPGSIGATTTPGRVMKGKKMAGHAGRDTVTVKNLKIIEVLEEKNLLVISGALPGPKKGLLKIKRTSPSQVTTGVTEPEPVVEESHAENS